MISAPRFLVKFIDSGKIFVELRQSPHTVLSHTNSHFRFTHWLKNAHEFLKYFHDVENGYTWKFSFILFFSQVASAALESLI